MIDFLQWAGCAVPGNIMLPLRGTISMPDWLNFAGIDHPSGGRREALNCRSPRLTPIILPRHNQLFYKCFYGELTLLTVIKQALQAKYTYVGMLYRLSKAETDSKVVHPRWSD